MKRGLIAILAMALAVAAPAAAQNMSLRGPAWAQPLLASDIIPTTGGRAVLGEAGVDIAARVTIAPNQGGVARVIRFEQRGNDGVIALRRFTGHPNTGWWIWGPETPTIITPTAAVRDELAGLVRGAIGVSANMGNDPNASCPAGEQAFVEMALGARAVTATRVCINGSDAVSRLVTRLSALAGSRNEEELHDASLAEILANDRAFSALAQSEGVSAAFAAYAAEDALMFSDGAAVRGREAVAALFANWPQGARMEWAPEAGGVSERGDLAWTWGRSSFTGADRVTHHGCYSAAWRRNWEGKWKFSILTEIAKCGAPAAAN
jgi:ketosteroid isomerase-like protein